MNDRTCAPFSTESASPAPSRAAYAPPKSVADQAAFSAASHVSDSGLSRKGRAALARLDAALPEARTLTSYERRDVRTTMSRVWGV